MSLDSDYRHKGVIFRAQPNDDGTGLPFHNPTQREDTIQWCAEFDNQKESGVAIKWLPQMGSVGGKASQQQKLRSSTITSSWPRNGTSNTSNGHN